MTEKKQLIRPKLEATGKFMEIKYVDRKMKCPSCGDFLTLDNVSILPGTSGNYADLICNKPTCLSKWLRENLEIKSGDIA